jgi:hypothetical protein
MISATGVEVENCEHKLIKSLSVRRRTIDLRVFILCLECGRRRFYTMGEVEKSKAWPSGYFFADAGWSTPSPRYPWRILKILQPNAFRTDRGKR